MSNEPPRPYLDREHKRKSIVREAAELVAQLPKDAIQFGVALIVNNDGTKQVTKKK